MKPGSSASPALAALRARTHALHTGLESRMLLARPGADRGDYARYVAAMRGWLAPLEPALWCAPWPAQIEPAMRACKTGWLDEDLRAARVDGYGDEAAARCDPAPPLDDPATRFGWAYVIEGSMLGGRVLAHRLGSRLAPWPMRFLRGYGEGTGRRWHDFLDALAGEVTSAAQIDTAAEAAAHAFGSIGDWFGQRGIA